MEVELRGIRFRVTSRGQQPPIVTIVAFDDHRRDPIRRNPTPADKADVLLRVEDRRIARHLARLFPNACSECGWQDPANADPCSICATPRSSNC